MNLLKHILHLVLHPSQKQIQKAIAEIGISEEWRNPSASNEKRETETSKGNSI